MFLATVFLVLRAVFCSPSSVFCVPYPVFHVSGWCSAHGRRFRQRKFRGRSRWQGSKSTEDFSTTWNRSPPPSPPTILSHSQKRILFKDKRMLSMSFAPRTHRIERGHSQQGENSTLYCRQAIVSGPSIVSCELGGQYTSNEPSLATRTATCTTPQNHSIRVALPPCHSQSVRCTLFPPV